LAACLLFVKRYCFKYFYYTTPEVGRPRSSTSAVFRPAPHAAGFCCYDTTPAAGRPYSQSLQFSRPPYAHHGFLRLLYRKNSWAFSKIIYRRGKKVQIFFQLWLLKKYLFYFWNDKIDRVCLICLGFFYACNNSLLLTNKMKWNTLFTSKSTKV